MASSPPRQWGFTATLRLDAQRPYLSIQHITVFVSDLDLGLAFYLDRLGFALVGDHRFADGGRWVAIAPPDGTAILGLVAPKAGSEEHQYVGRGREIVFISENVEQIFRDWSDRGVRFSHPPTTPDWGGVFTRFEDPDGNSYALVGFDQVSRELERQRQLAAEKLESERRVAQELQIAKQVQAGLFPQVLPELETLDYAGACVQARQVGGDYYDFLDLGQGKLGLVIADVSGKGIAAALLMANLQAILRSQCAIALENPQRLLHSANQLFCQNTNDASYATLFFGEYDANRRVLRYANCGHLPAILLRRDGVLDLLHANATVLGLFNDWESGIAEVQLFPGDILALYTDGVTEAFNSDGDEFGEQRLVETLRRCRQLPSPDLLAAVIAEVQAFGPVEQHDDITLMVCKCR